ncbi:hypothetical protein EXIGLDRAFT_715940 [Exidia glandulosa HHB12029]|uniref:Uncharacterized protein n=1 Tax=Exidia glandulosa HHB12029 TaxID=1314781 RepID=A0A165QPT5_EXIGL|nr:hypothetical protein EXIGLDRAFT_715940 [Exidia glandulosa HHB12029]
MNKRNNPFYPPAPPPAAHAPYTPTAQPAAQAPAQPYAYTGYWAQPQQYQAQPQPQWAPPQPAAPAPAPPAPSADHAALYANYGYGAQHQHNLNWQAQQAAQQAAQPPPQHQQQQHQQQGIPIPFASAYTPTAPQVIAPPPPYVPQQAQYHPAQPGGPPGLYNRPPPPPPPVHQPPPPSLPPAKRQRFDGPPPQQQQRFHPPPPPAGPPNRGGPGPMQQQQQQQQQQQSGPGVNQTPLGGGRGGGPGSSFLHANIGGRNNGPRGGGPMRGGPMANGARLGMRGRGGGAFGGGARLGPPPISAPMRGMARGPGPMMNRRQNQQHGGAKQHQNQRPMQSNQGRGGKPQGSGREQNGNQASNVQQNGASKSSTQNTKQNEPRRTFNDFKIVGMQIKNLGWHWGTVPESAIEESDPAETSSTETLKQVDASTTSSTIIPPPQNPNACRIRIYFHNPKIDGDGQVGAGQSNNSPVARTGKRKKVDDDEDDAEFENERRARQRPPPGLALKQEHSFAESGSPSLRGSLFGDGDAESAMRASVAGTEEPEEDWLMAAMAEGAGASAGEPSLPAENGVAPAGAVDASLLAGDDGAVSGDLADSSAVVGPAVPLHDSVRNDAQASGDIDMIEHAAHGADDGAAQTSAIASLYDDGDPSSSSAAVGGSGEDKLVEHDAAVSLADSSLSSASATLLSKTSSVASTVASDGPGPDAQDAPTASLLPQEEHDAYSTAAGFDGSDVAAHDYAADASHAFSPSSHMDDAASVADSSLHVDPAGIVDDESTIGWSRLSIAYAGGTRRLLVDSAIVPKLKIFRAEGRIEISLNVTKHESGGTKGIVLETLTDPVGQEYTPVPLSDQGANPADPLHPPLTVLSAPEASLVVYLDREKPLSAPKWVKSGDLQDWLRSVLGKQAAVPGEDSWIGRIEVVDPDPPPNIHSVLDVWVHSSNVGTQPDRQAFVATHMSNVRNVLEIVLRLVRSDRAGPFSPGSEHQSSPLVAAMPLGSSLAKHQTHITLAFLAVFKIAEDAAMSEGALDVLTAQVGEIVRCLPQHLLHKSLDNIFKDSKSGKKGK